LPVKPDDYKLICSKCGYNKIIKPKSDVDVIFPVCPKCQEFMDRKNLTSFDKFFDKINTIFPIKFK
jgi:NAD-dependent SIR2 family protein deacetylase